MKRNVLSLIALALAISGCGSDPLSKVQGVFSADKTSIEDLINSNLDEGGGLLEALANRIVENAVIEINVVNDSISGLIFMAGETTIIQGNLEVDNDTIFVVDHREIKENSVYLIPKNDQLIYGNKLSGMQVLLNKENRTTLSAEAESAISTELEREKKEREFQENIGVWQIGSFVDEFGDSTDKKFLYVLLEGEKGSPRRTTEEKVYVKAIMSDSTLYFDIYDEALLYKENMPNSEFGQISIKKESGEILTEEVFYYENSIYEREGNEMIYSHLHNESEALRILIDLSKVNQFMDDTYQFSIRQNNLLEIKTQNQ